MSDRELLEAAAKAAGIEQPTDQDGYVAQDGTFVFYLDCEGKTSRHWNPLEDDGDALRLAVKLGITIDLVDKSAYRRDSLGHLVQEYWGGDYPDCYRRAIVRAAASIGSGKESAS